MFTTSRGRPQGARNALRAVHEAGDRAGLNGDGREVSVRTTSGTRSSRLHSLPASRFPEASALARHANPRITAMAYAGLADDDRAKLAGELAAAFGR